jgi:hypothetical protein
MLAACLTAAAAAQAALGLSRRDWYTDDPWVRSTWFGNDAVTLVVVVPLLLVFSRPGSPRNAAVHTGLIAYCAYNYGFYLFGAALNVFFPLYVLLVLLSAILLARGLARTTPPPAARTSPVTRPVAIWLVFVGTGLASVWLGLWARYVFLGGTGAGPAGRLPPRRRPGSDHHLAGARHQRDSHVATPVMGRLDSNRRIGRRQRLPAGAVGERGDRLGKWKRRPIRSAPLDHACRHHDRDCGHSLAQPA